MIRAWRNELLCVTAIASLTVLLGSLAGQARLSLALVLFGYLGWHLCNFLLLQSWLWRRRSSHLPLSFGVWEAVFDGLQRRELRNRSRTRRSMASLFDDREAARSLSDAVVILTETGTVRWFNPAARLLLGFHWPGDLGKDITELLGHPALADHLAEGRSSRSLEVASPANGAWMLSIQVTALFGKRRERLLVARDTTAVFRLEQARRDFLASVSHELRTPITVFRGYLEALEDAASDSARWQTPVAHMAQQARRMQALVDDLLTLSRLEMTDRPRAEEPLPVHQMLAQVVADARMLSGEQKHDLRLLADPRIWLLGEEAEVHSVFSNLVFNAVRHTPPGTPVEILWQEDASGASFTVRDRGPAVAAHHLPRLTERFYRVEAGRSRSSGGSGLGLAIVKQVLEHYRSELRIASSAGKGTSFSCRFPASLVHIEPAAEMPRAG